MATKAIAEDFHFSMSIKILDEALHLYHKLISSNSLSDDLQQAREQAQYFEQKYNEVLVEKDSKIK